MAKGNSASSEGGAVARQPISARGKLALRAARSASWASRKTGRGAGNMIGGLIALKIDKTILAQLASYRDTVLVTGTNGKSTTTRMTAAALATLGEVATNPDGANMDAGIVAAYNQNLDASRAAIEVDELHLPHVADFVDPRAIIMLNLTRDQLDRVGEINMIERRLRAGLERHPEATIIANCDDVLITSVAYDCKNVIWVAAGNAWLGDSVSCPRTGEPIARDGAHWYSTGGDFKRPEPHWWVDDTHLHGPDGLALPMELALPGRANRGNAAQAVAASVSMGVDPSDAVKAVSSVREVAGRYSTVQVGAHNVRMLLAKNPAGWQEALSMVDSDADGLVIAVNGQVPDGEDLSWLWDVRFESFEGVQVVAAGERGTDLGVRLTYADVKHTLVKDPLEAIKSCPPGQVEVLANYTAFLGLNRAIEREVSRG
ncbi:Mur ligase family protein [Lolliginicoccus suaedae]|uniref:Mur ligase family protein n=1 Tax=Lolliginicoccus suaedae TaxID=2605429 RepID=UPI0011ED86C8|nr:Mur ligase family protein [Lolliginicoccus suaedae]